MSIPKSRASLVAAFTAGVIAVSLFTIAPAEAAPADRLATVRGQITTGHGHPIAGVRVYVGDGQPHYGADDDPDAYRFVTTSKSGRFSARVTAGRIYVKFEDRRKRFFIASTKFFTTKPGKVYSVHRVLKHISYITGTVLDTEGQPIPGATIHAFDAATGKIVTLLAWTDKNGRYRLGLRHGAYKVRFAEVGPDGRDDVHAEWFGDTARRVDSPTVTLNAGQTVDRIDATLE